MPELPRQKGYRCDSCGQVFHSSSGFDFHRVGHISKRRCLTSAQLEAKGWHLNQAGQWVKDYPQAA